MIIPEGATEAWRDLDFHLGDLTLTVHFVEPGEFFSFDLRLPDGSSFVSGHDKLPADGRVPIPRLRAGRYRLQIRNDEGALLLDEPVELTSDQEIVVSLPAGN